MSDPGIQFEEMQANGQKWFEPRFTAGNLISILATGLAAAGLYYGVVGHQNDTDRRVMVLESAVEPIPSMRTDISVLQTTIQQSRTARDSQVIGISGRVDGLSARVDSNQSTVDAKLDKIVNTMGELSNQVAAMNATLRAQGAHP